ncbi:DNA-binding protein [bacterium]|nr:DNA-binding protein [bacterium]
MKEYSDGKAYLLRFDKGEEVVAKLLDWAAKTKLDGAFLTGIGAVEQPKLGYYDAHKKAYIDREFDGEYEIASLAGNLGWDEANPLAHIHVSISGPNFLAFGGHLYSAIVSGTLEMNVIPFQSRLNRRYREELNLKLLD